MAPIVMYQQWKQLVFLHWAFDPSIIRGTLPAGVEVDTYDGVAYVGIVLINVHGARPRFMPALPMLSHFLQMNVRTYVRVKGGSGVWFYALQVNHLIGARLARHLFGVPAVHGGVEISTDQDLVRYEVARPGDHVHSTYEVAVHNERFTAEEGTLHHFLIERYTLFTLRRRGTVHHAPYELQKLDIFQSTPAPCEWYGVGTTSSGPVSALYSHHVSAGISATRAF